jgi:UDP-N-acetylmuramoyl-tripeptide--D-alanyl-D-alanine ligase
MLIRDLWLGIIGSPEGLERAMAPEEAQRPLTNAVVDSRAVQPGGLFVALAGEKTDGHLFLSDAFERGAVAALVEQRGLDMELPATFVGTGGQILRYAPNAGTEPGSSSPAAPPYVFMVDESLVALQELAAFWRAQMPTVVVAVTGSVGKTTTKETIASVLGMHFTTLRNQGNLNNEIGLPLTLLGLEREHERTVLEMGMYDLGEIARLCEIARPAIGVVTNVGPTHLERLGTVERIAKAKSELVRALPAVDDGGVAILNQDEPLVAAMRGVTRARVLTYGLDPASDVWADEISSEGLEGIGFQLHHAGQSMHVHLDMLGRHSVHTALRGAAVGLVNGMPWGEIIAGLQADRGNLRLMVVPGLRDTTLIDDTYNASPASMLAALNLLEDIANADHRAVAVLGDMLELGSFEAEGHRIVGGRAAQTVDKLITVGQRARWIAESALDAGLTVADVYPTDDNAGAIAILRGLVRAGDIILVKGSRGQRMETIVDALSRPLDAQS